MTNLFCLGLNHESAPVQVRECLAMASERLQVALQNGHDRPEISELVILSTCNRLELYAIMEGDSVQPLVAFLASATDTLVEHFLPHAYLLEGDDVPDHLCRVASGLDSLVLGEAQILGQTTQAYEAAIACRSIGVQLTALFKSAIRAGKRARSETRIGAHARSISGVAVHLAESLVGNLSSQHVLIIGAGEMAQLAVKALAARGVGQLTIANRTIENAALLARDTPATVISLQELASHLAIVDLLIVATGALNHVITVELLASARRATNAKPLVLIDLGVPRNIEPEVEDLGSCRLFNIDQLQSEVDAGRADQMTQVPLVERIIRQELVEYYRWRRQAVVRPLIRSWRQQVEKIRQQELARTRRALPNLDQQMENQLNQLTRALVNKLLHEPTRQLRQKAENGEVKVYAETLAQLFGLPDGDVNDGWAG